MSGTGSDSGWLEAAIAWEVCASLHRQYCKGKDALFTTRQSDFVKHAENARGRAHPAQEARVPLGTGQIEQGHDAADIAPTDATIGTFTDGVRFAEKHHGITAAQAAPAAGAVAGSDDLSGTLRRLDSKELAAWVDRGMALSENLAMYVQADCTLRESQARDMLRAHLFSAQPAPVAEDASLLDWLEEKVDQFHNMDRISSIVGVGFRSAYDATTKYPRLRDAIKAAREAQAAQPEGGA